MNQTRRDLLAGAGAAFTTSLFTGNLKGANDRVAVGYIGLGAMGSGNLKYGMQVPEVQIAALCDVYQPHLERAQAVARRGNFDPKTTKDFREILADKSIDAVCISTPDHWHPYMTVEACKAGKDVYVEKPASVYIDEGPKMVQAARKYKRVVQAGTMQRSGGYFQKAKAITESGDLGQISFCHTWQSGLQKNKEGWGNPPNSDPPSDLDWDMWLGPAPKVPFNKNRWGVGVETFPTFRYFWDYAGGAMTDWGVHLIDPIHQCLGEPMPLSINAFGRKFYVEDNRDTPDSMMTTWEYPNFLMSYESRTLNNLAPFMNQGAGTSIHGTEATVIVNRSGCWFIHNRDKTKSVSWEKNPEMAQMNVPHWKNWIECIRTRAKPTSEIETCVRSSASCILANLSMRYKTRLDWDEKNWTVKQDAVKPYLKSKYRAPWKLEV